MADTAEVPFAARRRATIEKAVATLSNDLRFPAGWLEGSLADGSADPYSDIDLYVYVADGAWESVWENRLAIVGQIAPVFASLDVRGVYGVGCLLEGPVKFDIFFEKDTTLSMKRRIAVKRLWGGAEIFERMKMGDDLGDGAIRAALEMTVLGFLQGATWPVRILARGQINTFLYGEILLVETGIVPLMLLRRDRRAFHRNMFTRARLLEPEEAAECAKFVDRMVEAVRSGDRIAMRDAHIDIHRKMCALARAAFDRFEMQFPPRVEDAMVSFYRSEWPMK